MRTPDRRITLDLVGLRCPLPIVELMKVFSTLPDESEVAASADDPAFEADVRAWCRQTGHELVDVEKEPDRATAIIRKKAEVRC